MSDRSAPLSRCRVLPILSSEEPVVVYSPVKQADLVFSQECDTTTYLYGLGIDNLDYGEADGFLADHSQRSRPDSNR